MSRADFQLVANAIKTAHVYANDDWDHLLINLVADRIADDFERTQEPGFNRERLRKVTQ
jgi:ABC-type uncharacterized transport system auxiliary subunit